MLPVRVVPNFLSVVECTGWIDYINELEKSRRELFVERDGRLALQLGRDYCDEHTSTASLEPIAEKELEARRIFLRVVKETGFAFGDMNELFVCAFWLAKQYPGAKVDFHEDTDNGANQHLDYSAIIYLNTQESGGELSFPKYGYTYTPKAGDLVMFDSKDAGIHGVMTIHEERYSLPLWMSRDKNYEL